MPEQNNTPVFTPKKDYCEPMHTAEHILNQTMVRYFGCGRSFNAHIEKSKSKCDYHLTSAPSEQQIKEVENKVNEIILKNLPVTEQLLSREETSKIADISKLPPEAGDILRVIKVGDYDICPCIGKHISNTSEIGRFAIYAWDYAEGRLRIRFKLESKTLD